MKSTFRNSTIELRQRVWNSPTLMSWMSLIARSLSLFLIIPLMVTRFSPADVALWYLFITALNLQLLADLGFSSTFIRVFSFARGGLAIDELGTLQKKNESNQGTNYHTVEHTWQVMNYVYARLSVIFFAFIALSSYFLYNPIGKSDHPQQAMTAWIIIIVTSLLQLRYSTFSNYLQGMNKVALVKKWETFFNLANILSSACVLWLGGNLLALVISTQFWSLVTLVRDYFLCRSVEEGRYKKMDTSAHKHPAVFKVVWPSAWKSGLGVLMSAGLLQITNMIFAQNETAGITASYLLGYSLLRQVSVFAQAAFYSRIPTLSRQRAGNDIPALVQTAQRGMQLTYWVFMAGTVVIGLAGTYALPYIKSNVNFPDQRLWSLLATGILIERFGAMHIQLYSTTNKIIWHIANGITGGLFLLSFFLLKGTTGVYVFPLSLLISNIGFYAWYCAMFSYKSIRSSFFRFEKKTFLPVLAFAALYIIFTVVIS